MGIDKATLLGGVPAADVLAAMELIAGSLLDVLVPAEHAAELLQGAGLMAIARAG